LLTFFIKATLIEPAIAIIGLKNRATNVNCHEYAKATIKDTETVDIFRKITANTPVIKLCN